MDNAPANEPAENTDVQPSRPQRRERGGRDFRARRKVCVFCVDKVKEIDYKNTARLRRFLNDRGKIEPRRKTGTCAKHQRRLATALKRARFMALLPYTGEHIRGIEHPGLGGRSDSGRPDGRFDRQEARPETQRTEAASTDSVPGAEPEADQATPQEQPQPANA
ncbi:MAG TPA: 30S ribosomal protein S18 [Chloroflexota bacterium]|nr:30S ribosomal protein S18 [Chloroflexota bacterium]